MLRTTWLLIVCLACYDVSGQTTNPFLPKFNYWAFSNELYDDSQLKEQLGVSPGQNAALKTMLSQSTLLKAFERKMEELRADPRYGRKRATESLAWHELDELVKKELSLIFDPAQLGELRRLVLQRHYPSGLSPFEESDVRSYLDLLPSATTALEASLTTGKKRLEVKVHACILASSKELVSHLPVRAREKFARYVGYDYLSGKVAPLIDETEKMAYPKKYRAISLIGECLSAKPSEVILEPKKVVAVQRIYKDYSEKLSFPDAGEAYLNKVSQRAREQLEEVLTNRDFLALAQVLARQEFEFDFRRVFGMVEPIGMPAELKFIDFLGLNTDETNLICDVVDAEWKVRSASLSKLQYEAFDSILRATPKDKQPAIRAFFAEVW